MVTDNDDAGDLGCARVRAEKRHSLGTVFTVFEPRILHQRRERQTEASSRPSSSVCHRVSHDPLFLQQ